MFDYDVYTTQSGSVVWKTKQKYRLIQSKVQRQRYVMTEKLTAVAV